MGFRKGQGMNRIADMKEASGEFLARLLKNRVTDARACFDREKRAFIYKFRNEIETLMGEKKEGENNLVISVLYSSLVTGSNVYRISWYDENIYLEGSPASIYYSPEFLFRNLEEDVEKIRNHLRKSYIRLMEYEVEEVRRDYEGKLYHEGRPFFAEMINGIGYGNINVWFGEYMNYVVFIGKV